MPSGVAASFSSATANRCLTGSRQQAEAVDHLHLQLAQGFIVAGAGDALVQRQPRVHVGQVVVGDQRRQVQFDLGLVRAAQFEVRQLAALERAHGTVEQLGVEREADLLDLPGLFLAQQLAGAADFQIVRGQREPGAQLLQRGQRVEALFGIGADRPALGHHQIGVGAVVRASDATAQLVQLGQPEAVGTVDDDGVGGRNVDAGFDDGGAHAAR